MKPLLVLITIIAGACGPTAAHGAPDRQGSAVPPRASGSEPTVWDAINQPHSEVTLLQCRGGSGFEFKSLGFKPTPQGVMRVAVAMTFAANPRAAGDKNENLDVGSCAPTNRPLASSEPREIHFIAVAFSQPFIGPIDVTPTAAEHYPDVRAIAAYLKDGGHYWTFNASETHHGYFDAATHQYWKDFGASPGPVAQPAQHTTSGIARWLVRITMQGGLAGTKREISVDADGRLQASSTSNNLRCSADLAAPFVQSLEAALARSHPETWRAAYVHQGNPNGCCDQIKVTVHVEQDTQNPLTSRETYWFNDSAAMVPEGVTALFKMVYDTRNACSQLGF